MPASTASPRRLLRSRDYDYRVYGLLVRSGFPLPLPQSTPDGPVGIELINAPASRESPAASHPGLTPDQDDWFHHLPLENGETYLRWTDLGEFWISRDGRRIACRALAKANRETFHTYLIPQAVSCALVKQGIEPLHATAVVINGEAVAFLGNCGFGKSSLGAAFLRAGHPLLTDDLLVMNRDPARKGRLTAHPGPARIKLFPEIADQLLGGWRRGARMNPETHKRILPLGRGEHAQCAVPLKALYILNPPTARRAGSRISIRTLSPRQACIALIANTYNLIITDRARLARQFTWAAGMAAAVPVKSLSYPRRLRQVSRVVAAVASDVSR